MGEKPTSIPSSSCVLTFSEHRGETSTMGPPRENLGAATFAGFLTMSFWTSPYKVLIEGVFTTLPLGDTAVDFGLSK